jgi:integrating conjugative element protein (TIGR03749 family)
MKPLQIAACLGLTLPFVITSSQAVEVMRWERLPLAIPLVVGQERVVFIDRNVRVGVPGHLGDRLRIQSAAGAVYLRANEPIDPVRLQLQDAMTGELVLIDVVAENPAPDQARLEDVRIIEEPVRRQRSVPDALEQSVLSKEHSKSTPVPVLLTRYAAQNLYAPLRTVEPLPGVRRVNLAGDLSLDLLMPSLPIKAKALAAWRMDEYWLTAVRLSNQTDALVELDPRLLLGDFSTATFQHQQLGPKGTSLDTSVVYLTTRGHGLAQSTLPTISPVDAALNVPPANPDFTRERNHEE